MSNTSLGDETIALIKTQKCLPRVIYVLVQPEAVQPEFESKKSGYRDVKV